MRSDEAPRTHLADKSMHDFRSIARDWQYTPKAPSGPKIPPAERANVPIVTGRLWSRALSIGAKICLHDFVTLQDHIRGGVPSPSVIVMLNLDEGRGQYRFGPEALPSLYGVSNCITADDDRELRRKFSRGDRVRGIVLQVSPTDVSDDLLAERVEQKLRAPGARLVYSGERLHTLARELLCSEDPGPLFSLLAESCGLELLYRSLSGDRDESDVLTPGWELAALNRVRDALFDDLGADHSLADLARIAGVSVSTLKTKFPKVFGKPVFELLRDERMRRAREGLKHHGWSVKLAAGFVGYAHPGNFARAYRRAFGESPGSGKRCIPL